MKIEYRHPHYPHMIRVGEVRHTGPDGVVVANAETGIEERVRHRDITKIHAGEDRQAVQKSMAHGFMAYATPETLQNIATDYADQYAPGHPAHLDASECDWHYDPAFPLANLPGTPEEWLAWHRANDRQLGFTANPTPIVVVQGIDGHHYLWDGNHRVGEAYAGLWEHAPAIVGESRMRLDQPDGVSPPGSVDRSGLRLSRDPRPLILVGPRDADLAVHRWAARLRKARPAALPYSRPAQIPPPTHTVRGDIGHPSIRPGHQLTIMHSDRSVVTVHNHNTGLEHTFSHAVWQGHHQTGAIGPAPAPALQKAMPTLGFPSTPAQIPEAPTPGQDPVVGEWPQMATPRYARGQAVQYQRPDMPNPEVGFIASHGAEHGTWVRKADGGRHPVRWEHIHGPAQVGVGPQERQEAATILRDKMGVPVDPLEHALLPDRAERPNPHLLARVEALLADGAPIDPKAVATLSGKELRRVVEHFTGPIPDEEQTRPRRDIARPQHAMTPWGDN